MIHAVQHYVRSRVHELAGVVQLSIELAFAMAMFIGNESFKVYLTLLMRGHPISFDVAG